jgi:hypothetical protein
MIDANYTELMDCMSSVQDIDVDLCRYLCIIVSIIVIHVYLCLSICLSIYLSIYRSLYLSIHPYTPPPLHLYTPKPYLHRAGIQLGHGRQKLRSACTITHRYVYALLVCICSIMVSIIVIHLTSAPRALSPTVEQSPFKRCTPREASSPS